MALIKCSECGKEISDKSTACIHCGCPIEIKKEKICPSCKMFRDKIVPMALVENDTKYECPECKMTILIAGKSFFGTIQESPQPNIPKCPTCGSTDLSKITTTQKAGKAVLFGLFAAGDMSKTWKCNKCGSKF